MTTAGNSTTPKMRMRAGPIHGRDASRSRPPRFLPVGGSLPPARGRPVAAPAGVDDVSVVELMISMVTDPSGGASVAVVAGLSPRRPAPGSRSGHPERASSGSFRKAPGEGHP